MTARGGRGVTGAHGLGGRVEGGVSPNMFDDGVMVRVWAGAIIATSKSSRRMRRRGGIRRTMAVGDVVAVQVHRIELFSVRVSKGLVLKRGFQRVV